MSVVGWALDLAVVGLLLGLAARIMFTRDLFEATVLFIAFGLTLSLAWVRLGAPDLALAEAALGAGVTGALFLNAFQRLVRKDERTRAALLRRASSESDRVPVATASSVVDRGIRDGPRWLRGALWVTALAAAGGLGALLLGLPPREPVLPSLVARHLEASGVSNPVTAVLLNFRAYDTLMEVGVLVVAMVAVWSLDRGSREFTKDPDEVREEPLLAGITRLVVPLAGVTAVYLAWVGSHQSGGAFQAGALLAGAGVLLAAGGFIRPVTSALPSVRALGVAGLAVFTAAGLAVMPWTGFFLHYPPGSAYGIILAVEGVLTLSIAVVLVELFVDVPAVPAADPSLEAIDPTGDPLGRTASPDGAVIRGAEE